MSGSGRRPLRAFRPDGELALGGEQPGDLAGEEGVSLRGRVQRADQLGGAAAPICSSTIRPTCSSAIPPSATCRPLIAERPEELLDLRAGAHGRLLVGDDHTTGDSLSDRDHEVEQRERLAVGGVEVVEHDEQRIARADVAQERADRVEQGEARLLRAQRAERLDAGHPLAQLGHDLGDPVRARVRAPRASASASRRSISARSAWVQGQ